MLSTTGMCVTLLWPVLLLVFGNINPFSAEGHYSAPSTACLFNHLGLINPGEKNPQEEPGKKAIRPD
jgi:hypothetical protein